MRVTMVLIVVGTLETVSKGLENRRIDTIQNTTLLVSAGILRRVLEAWENVSLIPV